MKKLMTLALAAGMLIGAATGASAVEFNAKGTWQFGFGVGDTSLVSKINNGNGKKNVDQDDLFKARQRVRLQLDAVASEALSGTVFFEIGHQNWGKASDGGALGADGMVVKVRQAYLDWLVPQTDLKIRMGLQNIVLPTAAGDGNVMHSVDTAAVVASYQFNENVGLTAMWARPFNDNSGDFASKGYSNYLDNMDLFMLSLPLNFANNGVSVTPWVMYGMKGKNTFGGYNEKNGGWKDSASSGNVNDYLGSNPFGNENAYNTGKAYGSMFWAGLPIKVTMLDPWNIEFDANYGYVEKMGRYSIDKLTYPNGVATTISQNASSKREGWLVKGLVEYKMDWGTPGLFAWYGSGDDSNLKNGSERMPYIYAENKFTSLAGEDVPYTGGFTDMKLSLDGSWGVGLQLKKLSFMEDLHHTIRVAYYGGTNSPKMARYANSFFNADTALWDRTGKDLYLTTEDGLLEFDVNTYYKIYDNLNMGLQLSYMVNMMDNDTWVRASNRSYSRQDAWAADLTFTYSF